MDHPVIREIEMYGYPTPKLREVIGVDCFGYELYAGDEVYELNDEVFLIEELTTDAIKVLEIAGAEKRII